MAYKVTSALPHTSAKENQRHFRALPQHFRKHYSGHFTTLSPIIFDLLFA